MASTATPVATDLTFERHDVVLGAARRQTVVTGFLLGGDVADLAVLHVDEEGDRRLRIYAFGDGAWAPALDATLRSDVRFVDVADIGGRDRLITYEPGRLSWFDPEAATERELLAVTSGFRPPRRAEVLHVDVTRDVNHDGRDDLVVPAVHGFWVATQTSDGAFAEPLAIGPSSGIARVYGADGYRYDPWSQGGRVHEMDENRDGRSDLVFWNGGRFAVHHQDEQGLFTPEATTLTANVTFDADQVASLAGPDMSGTVLHGLSDLNGDGVADLVTYSIRGASFRGLWSSLRSLYRVHSVYEVHLGRPNPDGGTLFATAADTAIRSDVGGLQTGMESHDLDRDGQVDMMLTTIDYGILEMIHGSVTGSMTLDLEFYRMDGGAYPDDPDTMRTIEAEVPPAEAGGDDAFFPPVLLGDVDGDGRADLILGRDREGLNVYVGVNGPDLFAERPLELEVPVPHDEEYTWLEDLDRDGRQDVVMHHPSATGPNRVTLLIAR